MVNLRIAVVATCLCTLSVIASAKENCLQVFKTPLRQQYYNEAKPAKEPLNLESGEPLGNITYQPIGEKQTYTLENYLTKFCTTGFLVLHKGQVVFERYLQEVRPSDPLLSASMVKSILSLLVGIAVSEGRLKLDERVRDVLPDFSESAFADVTVEELLRMTSGVALVTSYIPGGTSDNQKIDPMRNPRENVHRYLLQKKEFASSGKQFDYAGAVSGVLGLVLRARTGKTHTEYLAEKIWIPMGAKYSGYWIKNHSGVEGVSGQFAATLSDYARIGYLVMNKGFINGKQVVPSAWIEQMVTLRKDKPQPDKPPYYGLHIWIPQAAGGRSFFGGTNGQNIFIDPIAQTVIVHTGNSPDAEFNGNAHLTALRFAIQGKYTRR